MLPQAVLEELVNGDFSGARRRAAWRRVAAWLRGAPTSDRAFLPVRCDLAERWKQADRILHRLDELAPVRLYKIGDAYFVSEGHFRVSVAHYHGLRYVGAEVTEMRPLKDARVFAGAGPAIPTGAF